MRRSDPNDWMWAEACDLLDQAERLHRGFFRLSASGRTQATWEPPVDMFEDEREVVIVAAMPGVPSERVHVVHEPGTLVVRGVRPLPFAGQRLAVRQLEIPYGAFERRIPLPAGRLEAGVPELTHGCLVLRLRRIG
jgi:HSP20 family molecular chaperone IbpA